MTIKAFRIGVAPSAVDRRDRSPTVRADRMVATVGCLLAGPDGIIAEYRESLPPQGLEPPEQVFGDSLAGRIRPETIEFLPEHVRLEQPPSVVCRPKKKARPRSRNLLT